MDTDELDEVEADLDDELVSLGLSEDRCEWGCGGTATHEWQGEWLCLYCHASIGA